MRRRETSMTTVWAKDATELAAAAATAAAAAAAAAAVISDGKRSNLVRCIKMNRTYLKSVVPFLIFCETNVCLKVFANFLS